MAEEPRPKKPKTETMVRPETVLSMEDRIALIVGRKLRLLTQMEAQLEEACTWIVENDSTPSLSVPTGLRVEGVPAALRISARNPQKEMLEVGVVLGDAMYVPKSQEKEGGVVLSVFVLNFKQQGMRNFVYRTMKECLKKTDSDSEDDEEEGGSEDASLEIETDNGSEEDNQEEDEDFESEAQSTSDSEKERKEPPVLRNKRARAEKDSSSSSSSSSDSSSSSSSDSDDSDSSESEAESTSDSD